jgi:GrpB-like predicted nucleotidyltransferase (UPF0157 family)
MGKELSEMTLEELWQLFPIILKRYNTYYPKWFEIEAKKFHHIFTRKVIKRISHVGSTAIKGLIAKPTVDILLEIHKKANLRNVKKALQELGWILMFEQKHPKMKMIFNKGYTKKGFDEKVYHLHVRYYDEWNELYFRDYLCENKIIAKKYEKLKIRLSKVYKHNRDGYTFAKSEFIKRYTKKAKRKYKKRYFPRVGGV